MAQTATHKKLPMYFDIRSTSNLKRVGIMSALAVLYFFAGKLGLSLAFVNASATAIWAPTGIAIAAVILFGYDVWPAVFVGAFLTNITTAGTFLTTLCIATGNTLEAIVAGYLVNRYADGAKVFEKAGNIFRFSLIAIISAFISAGIGVFSLNVAGFTAKGALPEILLTWLLGDLGGALIVTPFLIILATMQNFKMWIRRYVAEIFFLFIALIVSAILIFWSALPESLRGYPLQFFVMPPLILIALWLGRRWTTIGMILLAFIATLGTVRGLGPFAVISSPNTSLIFLQLFLSIVGISSLMLATVTFERFIIEQALVMNERHFRSLIENSSDGVELLDAKGMILYASAPVERITGYPSGELIGRSSLDGVFLEDRERALRTFSEVLEKPGKPVTFEVRIRCKKGIIKWIEVTATNRLSDPAVAAIVVNFRDVSERKEEQLAKNRFISTVSGELHAPLARVETHLAALKRRKGKFSPIEQKYLSEIEKANRSMSTLVGDLLRLMRIELGTITMAASSEDVGRAIDAALKDVAKKVSGKSIILNRHYAPGRTTIMADRNLLAIVLHRLLSWTIDFSPEKSRMNLALQREGEQVTISISCAARVPTEVLNTRFRSREGEGSRQVGDVNFEFYAMRSITELMGGTLRFELEEEGSGKFILSFPVVKAKRISA